MNEIKEFLQSRAKCNLVIVAINVIVFFILECMGSTEDVEFMLHHGASYLPYILEKREYYRLFTCMFLHFGIEHLFNNMLVLIFLGDTLENTVGSVRYLIIYLGGGILANVISCYAEWHTEAYSVSAGASGAIFAVVGALIYIVILNKGKLENLTGRGLFLMVMLTLYQGYTSIGVDNTAHIGGLLSGLVLAVLLYHKSNTNLREADEW